MNNYTTLVELGRFLMKSNKISDAETLKVLDLIEEFISKKKESNDE